MCAYIMAGDLCFVLFLDLQVYSLDIILMNRPTCIKELILYSIQCKILFSESNLVHANSQDSVIEFNNLNSLYVIYLYM
jgi:hypothetical protein